MKQLIRFSVERPVTVDMLYAAVVLLGIIVLAFLPRELFPSITYPQIVVVTRYGSAAPEEIENIITKVIEEQAGTIPNLKRIRSISKEGLSIVILEFNWGTDMGLAQLSVREKLDLIKDRLPTEAEEPIAQSYNPFVQPMMILSISGDLPIAELTRLSNDVVKKRLQKVEGVASATVSGGQEREILVEVDSSKMIASNLSITGVVDALKNSNVNYPAGSTQGRFYEYLVRTIGEFQNVSDISHTVIAVDASRESTEYLFKPRMGARSDESFQPRAQRMIPLGAIADIKDTFKETESYSRHDGKPNVSIALQKQYNANGVKTAARVRSALKELAVSLPKEMQVSVVYDESVFIRNSLNDVTMEAVEGGVLAFLVLLFFLRSLRDASIVTLSLPISILVAFIALYFMGRTINVIALAGLSLAIGSITDNAICILDNIDKYRHKVAGSREAAVQGASEVAMAQLTSMLTIIVVFLPLLFARGIAQQLFKDLFITAVASHIAALLVAITLIPRIAGSFGSSEGATAQPDVPAPQEQKRHHHMVDDEAETPAPAPAAPPTPAVQAPAAPSPSAHLTGWRKWLAYLMEGLTEERARRMDQFYSNCLVWAITHRKKVLTWAAGLFLMSLGIFYFKDKIFMPQVDQGQFLMRLNMPVGTRLDVTNRNIEKLEKVLSGMPEIGDVLARVGADRSESIDALGPHQGECLVTLDRKKTRLSTEKVILKTKEKLKGQGLEGGELEYILQDSAMKGMGASGAPVEVTLKGPGIDQLRQLSDSIQRDLRSIPGVLGVKTSLPAPSYETRVAIDKDHASGFNLSVFDISRASLVAIHGMVATYLKDQGKEIGIRVRLMERDRNDPSAIQAITVRNQQGLLVPLGQVATISAGYGPSQIERIDQQRAVVVSAQIFGRSLGDVLQDLEPKLAAYKSMKDYSITLGGTKQEMQESFGGLIWAFLLAVALTYMIMAAGFENLLHPFLIMGTVPLGVIGVALTLAVTFVSISVPVILGIVLLGGIVVNNGIVLIDHINYLRKEGKTLEVSIVEGCISRLRPVLMTAVVAVLSLFPVALGIGEGTEMSSPMALATLGGLFISTLLTLIIIPILYYMFEARRLARNPAPTS